MKALSVRFPFAMDILLGLKTIELRSRPTNHRGELLIVPSKSGVEYYCKNTETGELFEAPKGAMMCVVKVVDCRPATPEDAELAFCEEEDIKEGTWAWVLEPQYLTEFKPCAGKLNLFDVDDNLIQKNHDKDEFVSQFQKVERTKGKYPYIAEF